MLDMIGEFVKGCEPAEVLYAREGVHDVMSAFNLANMLHLHGYNAPASHLYRAAFDFHDKRPDHFPSAHGLLQVRLLCLLKAGLPLPDQELDTLKRLCTPFYNYIRGCRELFATQPDYKKTLVTMGNSFEEFHTGEESDCMYLKAASRYFDLPETGIVGPGDDKLPPAQLIPRRLFFYWDQNPPDEIVENFRYHRELGSFDVEVFDKGRAEEWLYHFYGCEAREIFLSARHPAEAADILRVHVINSYGGYWVDADMKIRSQERFDLSLPRNCEGLFPVTNNYYVHNDFFGSVANSPVLSDCLLSLYRNCYLHRNLYIAYKTGPGIFCRALNRVYYRALMGRSHLPRIKIVGQDFFDHVLESYPVTYKHGAGSWHTTA